MFPGVHLLGGGDVPEELEVPHGELCRHLHCAELQQADLALPQEVLGIVIRAQGLRVHVVLQVVPVGGGGGGQTW